MNYILVLTKTCCKTFFQSLINQNKVLNLQSMNILNDKSYLNISRQNDIEQVQQQKQEFKLIGTYLRTAGLNLYCYNPHKDAIEEVKIIKSKNCILVPLEVGFEVQDYEKPKIQIDPTWDYFEALNLSSAKKRVERFKQGKIKFIWNLRLPNKESIKLF